MTDPWQRGPKCNNLKECNNLKYWGGYNVGFLKLGSESEKAGIYKGNFQKFSLISTKFLSTVGFRGLTLAAFIPKLFIRGRGSERERETCFLPTQDVLRIQPLPRHALRHLLPQLLAPRRQLPRVAPRRLVRHPYVPLPCGIPRRGTHPSN